MESNTKVAYLTIAEANAGQRIDNYLVKKLNNVPKSKIYSILRKGEVRVNKGRIKPSYKLQADDIVRLPPLVQDTKPVPVISQPAIERINIEQAILYEDENMLIINKPTGLAVHGGSGVSFGLIELLRTTRADFSLELVHRLDRDTSGCVLVAKNPPMLRAMHKLFASRQINKIYHTIVKGFARSQFSVKEPLKKSTLSSGERMVSIHPEGDSAHTDFAMLKRLNGATLLEAKPITGRTHQIRVHAASSGLPIIGDTKYGDKAYNKVMAKVGVERLFLHAHTIDFICPLSGKPIKITAELDDAWLVAMEILQAKG